MKMISKRTIINNRNIIKLILLIIKTYSAKIIQTIIKDKIAPNNIYVIICQKIILFFVSVQHSSYKQQVYFQQQINGIQAIRKIKKIINIIIIMVPPSIKSQK